MTPEEIWNMTIEEYAKYRETQVFDEDWMQYTPTGWTAADRERASNLAKPKMSEKEYKELLEALKPSEEQVKRAVEHLLEQDRMAEEEAERMALREELTREQR